MLAKAVSLFETILLLSVATLYIVQCPFNKVEESFNTQAVHDVINIFPHQIPHDYLSNKQEIDHKEIAIRTELPWDHMQFSGVVPRTSIGALAIGLPLKVIRLILANLITEEEPDEPDFIAQFIFQICARTTLSFLLVISLTNVTKALHKRFGLGFRLCFLFTTLTQFHYLFYSGRFLPNTYACILSNLVFATWINRQFSKSLIYIAICVLIFRVDTSLFFGCLIFDAIFIKKVLPLTRILTIGIPAGLVALSLTLAIDSLFWARLVWPEFEAVYFNVWLNKSHEWGVQPYFWYLYSCLLRILMFSSPFIVLAEHKITRDFFMPTLAFILIYSLLPHKELRFILFVSPFLNICAVSGLMNIHYQLNKFLAPAKPSIGQDENRDKLDKKANQQKKIAEVRGESRLAAIIFIIIMLAMIGGNLFGSYVLTRVSSYNYPGGQAALSLGSNKELLDEAQKSVEINKISSETIDVIRDPRSNVAVYVNNLAAQTGMSRFVQVNGAYYSKTPKIDSTTFRKSYDIIYLILEPKEIVGFLKSYCPEKLGRNHELTQIEVDDLKSRSKKITCKLPNQVAQHCTIIETISKFKSVNIGGLLNKLRASQSIKQILESLEDKVFIQTRIALHIIRCGNGPNRNY